MSEAEVTRRSFLSSLGITAGATFAAASGAVSVAGVAQAQTAPKGNIPDKPYRIGHMTFFTGPAAVLGEPMYKGNLLAAEEINAKGGLLGKRKIEILKADEAAGTDAIPRRCGASSCPRRSTCSWGSPPAATRPLWAPWPRS